MSDDQLIRDRVDKVPDDLVCQRMLGKRIVDVIHYLDLGATPPRDTLYLVAEDGAAFEIEAERLYLDYVPEFEKELDSIRIVAE